MSEQGELKDRIWSAMPKILLFAVAQNTSSDTMNKELKVIDTIIDEAVKEFPKQNNPKYWLKNNSYLFEDFNTKKYIQDVQNWHIKWFGE